MRKVGVITFLHNDNYGSTLQAYALQTMLRDAGYDAVHIDYQPDLKQKILNMISSGNSPALLIDSLKRHRVKQSKSDARAKSLSFSAFYQQYMRLCAVCHNRSQLSDTCATFDTLICGSDQIWSPVWFNPVYFLNFANGTQKKIAYACSLGVSQVTGERKLRMIKTHISDFDAVSLREKQGAALLSQVTETNYPVMPDPVCLLTRDAWLRLSISPKDVKPYIACYFIGDQPAYWQKAQELGRQTGYEIRVIPVTDLAYTLPYHMEAALSPQAWLGVLSTASIVLTDSFHGTLFSLLLGRPFVALRRYSDTDIDSKNSRIDHLFSQFGLNWNTINEPNEKSEAVLEQLRKTGTDWLISSLSGEAP